ncbi:proteinase inhibitor I4 serpin [Kribbella antibiotica]|uniref:Proteinase inhibitor I4 serpin n=1 Tax=Kribbella antibiotica TaxID=190195 RepID=A0A4R4ZJN1_9ACTN|nr:serpin family protein [Kribbella antibiotica]TDD58961.1 proteinase inhibitor I4 serpin [Kribbella antibiotica]
MDADAVRAVNDLTGRWVRSLPPGNSVVSGLGLWPLLAILATAADEPGRAELAAAAEVAAGDGSRLAVQLIEALESSTDLHAALGVWISSQLKLAESFDDVVPAPVVGMLTGDAAIDKPRLDAWAAEHTDGLIPSMPVDIDPNVMLVLASALCLRTTWARPFTEQVKHVGAGAWEGSWHWLERTDGDLDSVRRYGALTVITVRGDADVDVLLGVGSGDVVGGLLDAVGRPADGVPGSELIKGSSDEVAPGVRLGKTSALRPDVRLSLPSFEVSASHDLLDSAELFGLSTVSSDSAGHFSAISPSPLAIGQAKQEVLARFFATGFEAAAVTSLAMVRAAAPMRQALRLDVVLDRPFAFAAVLRESRLPIVAGWVDSPTETG